MIPGMDLSGAALSAAGSSNSSESGAVNWTGGTFNAPGSSMPPWLLVAAVAVVVVVLLKKG